ncbi:MULTISPECIES: DUF1428 domain-containing protein [unclassified Sphingomonas]|jgi:uncharacterized protein YbaA (DUF1428 family)|uniref:DUF1428 domain-containing protein n=1 Tax=unclassified Sphingomonas TaxID=196159 RepID=UPI00082F7D42
MTYVEGFVLAVPAENKDAYLTHAQEASAMILDAGVARMVECWEDDVPDGTHTDFRRAVKAQPDEKIIFSWFEYPDRAARDAAGAKMMADPRMEDMSKSMPFDGRRMIYGGFSSLLDLGDSKGGYTDGFLVAVPTANRDAYLDLARQAAEVFIEYGANRVVEAWGDDVPDGKVTDYRMAVQAGTDENVVYSWIEWPSKAHRDTAWEQVMADPRMQPDPENRPFDGKRMIYGGFTPILDR